MGQMKLKKISKKKKYKYVLLIMIVYLVFGYTFYYSFKNNRKITNEEFIKYLLNNGNINLMEEYKLPKVIDDSLKYILKIDIRNPVSLFNENILGYTVEEEDNNEDLDKLKEISTYISDPFKSNPDNPLVYIYNSHQLENYNNDYLSIYGITPNVLMASYLLKEKLYDLGIPAIVEDTNITEFLELNNWDYGASYKASRIFMLDKQNTYPSIKYFIDIHRDSVSKNLTTVKIDNKDYAKILFVIGLEHDNYQANLDLASKLNSLFEEYYPGLSRGILKKEGMNVNGIYNQDISPNVMLIEVGGVDNNIAEVMNTLNAISIVLSKYIGDNN